MILYLMRHGNAGARIEDDPEADAARALVPEGREELKRVATGLHRLGVAPPVVVCSPMLRTQQTADIVANVLTPGQIPTAYDWLYEHTAMRKVTSGMRTLEPNTVVVTHRDIVEAFTAYIVDGRYSTQVVAMPFASMIAIDTELDQEVQAGIGHVEWLMLGQQLAEFSGLPAGALGFKSFSDLVVDHPAFVAL